MLSKTTRVRSSPQIPKRPVLRRATLWTPGLNTQVRPGDELCRGPLSLPRGCHAPTDVATFFGGELNEKDV